MTNVRVALYDTQGRPKRGATVYVQLLAGPIGAAHVPGYGEILGEETQTKTGSDGTVTLALTPNVSISPAGTFYRITAPEARWHINVPVSGPVGGGTWDVGDTLIQVVSPVPPDWVPLKGDKGDKGDPAAAYFTTITPASAVWTINHNQGRFPPNPAIRVGGALVQARIEYVTANQIIVRFNSPQTGDFYF